MTLLHRLLRWLVLPSLCGWLAASTFWETHRAGFVWDDRAAILKNADVVGDGPLANLWTNDFWGEPINTASR